VVKTCIWRVVPAAAVMKELQPHSYYRVFFIFFTGIFLFYLRLACSASGGGNERG
jgi:hypothetical protein